MVMEDGRAQDRRRLTAIFLLRIAVLGGTEFLVSLLGRATDDAVVEGSAVALSNLALSDEGRTRLTPPPFGVQGSLVDSPGEGVGVRSGNGTHRVRSGNGSTTIKDRSTCTPLPQC